MSRALTASFLFVIMAVPSLASAQTAAPAKPVTVWPAPAPSPGSAPAVDFANALAGNVANILNSHPSKYQAAVATTRPTSGLIVLTAIRVVADPANLAGKPRYFARLTSTDSDFGGGTPRDFDITNRSAPNILEDIEVLSILEPANRHPNTNIVLMNEGPPDSRTANSAFNGPAYIEARLIEELARQRIDALPLADFLSNSSASAVVPSTDEGFAVACKLQTNLLALRYILQYSETTNPLFGTQNGTAHVDLRIQRCASSYADSPLIGADGNTRNYGNTGLLFGQYFRLLNFSLTVIRKNPQNRGFFGTDGSIVSSLLPNVANTAAESRAVGETARRSACLVSLYVFDQRTKLKPDEKADATTNPCSVNDAVRKARADIFGARL